MTKTNWNRTLAEVLKQETKSAVLISKKGIEYTTDIVPMLKVVSIGSVEEINGEFKYSVVDVNNDLEYVIKVANKVEVKFGTLLQFTNVRGGTTSNGVGWYAADSVVVVQRNG